MKHGVAPRQQRPLGSFLLRVYEERVELVRKRYELLDLASGTVQQFPSLAALHRHLHSRAIGEVQAAETPHATRQDSHRS